MDQDYTPKRKEIKIDLSKPMPSYELFRQYDEFKEALLDHEEPIIAKAARRAGMTHRSLGDKLRYMKDRVYYSIFPMDNWELIDQPAHLAAQNINSTRIMKYISAGIGLTTGALAWYANSENPESLAAYYWTGKSIFGFGLAGLLSFVDRRQHRELSKTIFKQMPNVALQIADKYPILHLDGSRVAKFRPRTKSEERKLSMQRHLGFSFGRRRVDLRDVMTDWEAIEKSKTHSQDEYREDVSDDNNFDEEDDGESWKS